MGVIGFGSSLKTTGQFALDPKIRALLKAELETLGTGDANAYGYYEDMDVFCLEDKKTYRWREEESAGETDGLVATSFTYPPGLIVEGIDYGNRVFNFFEVALGGGGSPLFAPTNTNGALELTEDHGGLTAGTTLSSLKLMTRDDVLFSVLFKTAFAVISSNRSTAISGVSGTTVEVGSVVSITFAVTFNQGAITNGDGTAGPALVGTLNNVLIRDIANATIYTDASPVANAAGYVLSNHTLIQGSNRWSTLSSYDAGTGTYKDSTGATSTNLDGSRNAGSISSNSSTITGVYKMFVFTGSASGTPSTSAGVRALPLSYSLNTSNNITQIVVVPANTPEVAFILPAGKTVQVQDTGTFDILTRVVTAVAVDDAGGSSVSYERHIISLGAGFPGSANFEITAT